MIYLYGLLDAGAPDAEGVQTGVTGAVDEMLLPQGRLLHSHHDGTEILPKRRLMLAHARVLETAATRGTVLPMRFGMLAEDLDTVTAIMAAQGERIASELERLHGAAEYGLRVSFDRDAALGALLRDMPALAGERDALKARNAPPAACAAFGRKIADALDRRRGAAQKRLLAALRPDLRDHILRAPEDDVQVLSADILVPAGDDAALAEHILTAAKACGFAPGAEPLVRLVGPQPAYSFTRLTLAAREAA